MIFSVTPQVRDDSIELQISQQISSFTLTSTGVNNSPTLIKRDISTSVGATDGDIIMIGGLDETRESLDSSGFSFIPDFFRSRSGSASSSQILLVLHVSKL